MLIAYGDLSVGIGGGDDNGGGELSRRGMWQCRWVKAMRCSMSEQGQRGAFGEQRQSDAETPLANEAASVECIEERAHKRCGGARIVCLGKNVSTMNIGAPR